jgi:hypothetical protein
MLLIKMHGVWKITFQCGGGYNPRPLCHESSALTTRQQLLAYQIKTTFSFKVKWCNFSLPDEQSCVWSSDVFLESFLRKRYTSNDRPVDASQNWRKTKINFKVLKHVLTLNYIKKNCNCLKNDQLFIWKEVWRVAKFQNTKFLKILLSNEFIQWSNFKILLVSKISFSKILLSKIILDVSRGFSLEKT